MFAKEIFFLANEGVPTTLPEVTFVETSISGQIPITEIEKRRNSFKWKGEDDATNKLLKHVRPKDEGHNIYLQP
jgi:hypothetical protein